ncbi:hypothetical protein LTR36_001851 [Oleoguttula mirabilis]|uniref:Uncharacterized protein n=1 Tax=Oleoguttula mirabilis TaxID=1507867 RepID=A0AAV9JNP9_9PEZI|nr:hypothetical protein LTR36_001851 [Oleoguttula mirabilis]
MLQLNARRDISSGSGTKSSGGKEGLNATQALTPSAFAEPGGHPIALHDMPQANLVDTWNKHVYHAHVKTVFTSFSIDLAWILGSSTYNWEQYFRLLRAPPPEDLHVPLIDTRGLGNNTVALSTASPHLANFGFLNSPHHALVYGIVSGPGHKAVSVRDLKRAGIAHFTDEDEWRAFKRAHFQDEVVGAQKVGELFGNHLALPMIVYLLAIRGYDANEEEQVLEAVSA